MIMTLTSPTWGKCRVSWLNYLLITNYSDLWFFSFSDYYMGACGMHAYMNCPKTCLIEREKCSSLNWYLASKHVWFEWNWAMREHDPWHVVRCGRYQDVYQTAGPHVSYNMQMFCIFLYIRPHRACFRDIVLEYLD